MSTLSNGTQSVTPCSSGTFGCTLNDTLSGQSGILDNGSKLICEGTCDLEDKGLGTIMSGTRSSFTYNVTGLGDGEVGDCIGGPPQYGTAIGVGPLKRRPHIVRHRRSRPGPTPRVRVADAERAGWNRRDGSQASRRLFHFCANTPDMTGRHSRGPFTLGGMAKKRAPIDDLIDAHA